MADNMSSEQEGFETKMARLREIVSRLEQEDLPLEEGVALFQEGSRLSRECRRHLQEAEHRVRQHTDSGLQDIIPEREDTEDEPGDNESSP